ncbi:MAG: type I methionyl aminopeptidase [Actinobacteria bacterium]|nr:type I methionyl aminopeptidase [Actinomycetota bacterium]MBW3649168.1 type I methionyl aminopeptidase [Actinomycetota bacterium]
MNQVLKSNDLCWCGSGRKFKRCHKAAADRVRPGRVTPMRPVPPEIPRPPYAETGEVERRPEPRVKTADVLARMRVAGRVAAEILQVVGAAVRPGVTTEELDALAHEEYLRRGAYPSPLNYHGYPKSICTSVNEVICHGIPDDRRLADGDIVNVDVTAYVDGVHGDTNATFLVGEVDEASRRLVQVTRECLDLGIAAVRPGRPLSDIGRAIQEHAEAQGYGVVRSFIGHGIGEQFHTDLHILHYYEPRLTTEMEPGMTFTIEPMITMGDWRHRMWDDGWTAVTVDLKRTAQFEHTLVVTGDGADVLTDLSSVSSALS